MSKQQATPPRRKREPGDRNRNIYVRPDGRFEVGFRDSNGVQRWKVDGFPSTFTTVTEARKARDSVLGRKAIGEKLTPSPKLRFGEVADRWLAEDVSGLRPTTRTTYTNHVEHLRKRWGKKRMDEIGRPEAKKLVKELRAEGLSEWTMVGIVGVAARVFRFAIRDCDWKGQDATALLLPSERPKASETPQRRIYTPDELAQVLAVTTEQWTTLLRLGSVIGGRQAELLGLCWEDLDISDLGMASVHFGFQVDNKGNRVQLKTEESKATLPLPRSTALMLAEHKARSTHTGPKAFVFATANGRAINPRNALRVLYKAQENARKEDGTPTFPELFEHDEHGHLVINEATGKYVLNGKPRRELRLPHFHSLRHTAAMSCGDVEEARDLLRHKNSTVTAKVYRAHFSDQRREALRSKLEARHGTPEVEARVEATDGTEALQTATPDLAEVRQLRA